MNYGAQRCQAIHGSCYTSNRSWRSRSCARADRTPVESYKWIAANRVDLRVISFKLLTAAVCE